MEPNLVQNFLEKKKSVDEKAAKKAAEDAEKEAAESQKAATTTNETLTKYMASTTTTLTKLTEALDNTVRRVATLSSTPQTINVQNNQQNVNNKLAVTGQRTTSRELNGLLQGRQPGDYLEEDSLTRSGRHRLK